MLVRASCLPETSRRALVANAREDSPVSDALLAIPEKRDAFLSPSRFSNRSSMGTAAPSAASVRRFPPRVSPGLSTFNFQLSTFNFQLSTFNFQLSTFQPSARFSLSLTRHFSKSASPREKTGCSDRFRFRARAQTAASRSIFATLFAFLVEAAHPLSRWPAPCGPALW
jgi:hypothetical protein